MTSTPPSGSHVLAAVACASCQLRVNVTREFDSPRGSYSLCLRCAPVEQEKPRPVPRSNRK